MDTILQRLTATMLVLVSGGIIFASELPLLRQTSEYTVHIMLAMLVIGMLALIFDKTKVMFIALACTAALCVFLKQASMNSLKLPQANEKTKINVVHINLSNITDNFEEVLTLLHTEDIDIISFQELTPDWSFEIHNNLNSTYPYNKSEVRIDPYGMAVYSKYPLRNEQIIFKEGIPNLNFIVEKENTEFELLFSYLEPALTRLSIDKASRQLQGISAIIKNSSLPVIALGEYNMVYWTNEIKSFREDCKLHNSRRDLSQGNLRVPYDHIFFNEKLECVMFKEIKNEGQNYIGIMGKYQIKDKSLDQNINAQLSYQ